MPGTKTDWRNLAALGGPPLFSQPLHVGRPNIGDRNNLLARFDDMLSRRWLSNNGPFVRELERRIVERTGVRHCIATCNGTIGLEIGIRALGLTGEVIVPAFTFVATAHAVRWLGLTLLFCDVDRATHNIDPRQVERHITPRTSGIIGVHLWGRPCDTERLEEIAARRRLSLMFDAAHAFAASRGGRMIGNFGSLEVFSFHATKFFNTFEGGAIVTNSDELATRARMMRDFGYGIDDEVVCEGTNGKMSEAAAAMGLTGMESLDEFLAANRHNYDRYAAELAGLDGIEVLSYDPGERMNYQYVIVEVDQNKCGVSRDTLLRVLRAENVLARRYFSPGCHHMAPYRASGAAVNLPVTDALSSCVLALPTGTAVGAREIGQICALIRMVVAQAGKINAALSDGAEPDEGAARWKPNTPSSAGQTSSSEASPLPRAGGPAGEINGSSTSTAGTKQPPGDASHIANGRIA